jgi:hypothetical protein
VHNRAVGFFGKIIAAYIKIRAQILAWQPMNPYVLNPLTLLKLIQNIERRIEININNGNSKLQ